MPVAIGAIALRGGLVGLLLDRLRVLGRRLASFCLVRFGITPKPAPRLRHDDRVSRNLGIVSHRNRTHERIEIRREVLLQHRKVLRGRVFHAAHVVGIEEKISEQIGEGSVAHFPVGHKRGPAPPFPLLRRYARNLPYPVKDDRADYRPDAHENENDFRRTFEQHPAPHSENSLPSNRSFLKYFVVVF